MTLLRQDRTFSLVSLLHTFCFLSQVLSFTPPCNLAKIKTSSYLQFSSPYAHPVQKRVIDAPNFPSRFCSIASYGYILKAQTKSSVIKALSSSAATVNEPLFEGFGEGVLRDYKARLPLYLSDIKDGLNVQVCSQG